MAHYTLLVPYATLPLPYPTLALPYVSYLSYPYLPYPTLALPYPTLPLLYPTLHCFSGLGLSNLKWRVLFQIQWWPVEATNNQTA